MERYLGKGLFIGKVTLIPESPFTKRSIQKGLGPADRTNTLALYVTLEEE